MAATLQYFMLPEDERALELEDGHVAAGNVDLFFGNVSELMGMARAGSGKTMGRVGGKALLLFQVTASLSLVFGLATVLLVRQRPRGRRR